MKTKVIVIGHKNPDTDSICSAIAYANLKNKLSSEFHVPGRAGEVGQETKFVLEKFNTPIPDLLTDAGTQAKDIDIRKTEGVDSSISLKEAWALMRDKKVATLPVTTQDRLIGLISVKDIATANMDIYDNRLLAKTRTTYKNILETLNGTLIVGDDKAVVTGGKILIAAANPDMLENYIQEGDMVILGNRYESQLCAIEMDASCIIVCMDAPISKTIKKLAEQKGCNVISVPYDTYITARLINQSTPIDYFMKREDLVTFQTDDFTEEIKGVMAKVRHRDFPVLDVYGRYVGMISRRSLLDVQKKKLILVDHNEKSQAVEGIEGAEILEIIDHHRIGNLETMSPVFFRNQPVGCTATIIYQMYEENKVEIDANTAGLLCAAIITDTLMFRSPTCTQEDRNAAEALAKISQVEISNFADEIFKASSDIDNKTPEEVLYQDFKRFSINGTSFGVAQNLFVHGSELDVVKAMLTSYLDASMEAHHVQMLFVMLTNIIEESTELLCYGKGAQEAAESAMGVKAVGGILALTGVVSRKKQIIPALMSVLQ